MIAMAVRRCRCGLRTRRCATVVLLLLAGPAWAQPVAVTAGSALVPAQFNQKQDKLGGYWNLQSEGTMQSSGNSPFQMAGYLTVNGSSFSTQSNPMMTADGNEYHLAGVGSSTPVMRRVRFDLTNGTVRYLDRIQNSSPSVQTLTIAIRYTMQFNGTALLAPSGTDFNTTVATPAGRLPPSRSMSRATGVLSEANYGLALVRPPQQTGSMALLYLAGLKGKLRPQVRVDMGREVYVTYVLTLKPGESTLLAHGLAQRTIATPTTSAAWTKLYQPFLSRKWIADLPADERKAIANLGSKFLSEELARGPLLQPVVDLAKQYDVERGPADIFVQDEQTNVSGKVEGEPLTVTGRYGKSTVPLGEIALVVGSAGVDRPARVYLRTGEVLCGEIEAPPLKLTTERGLEMSLEAGKARMLFMRVDAADGKPPEKAVALVQTHEGERVAVLPGETKFTAATPWGPAAFALGDFEGLYLRREPHPVYRLLLRDGSRLPVVLQGEEIEFETTRFGKVRVPPLAVGHVRPLTAEEPEEPAADDGELKTRHFRLAGENVLVGTFAAEKLALRTESGETTVDTAQIRRIEPQDEGKSSVLDIEVAGQGTLRGTPVEPLVEIKQGERVWTVPVQHLVSYLWPEEPTEPKTDEKKPDEKPSEPAPKDRATPRPPTAAPLPTSRLIPADPFGATPVPTLPAPSAHPTADDPFR